jgi:hypothetical protein
MNLVNRILSCVHVTLLALNELLAGSGPFSVLEYLEGWKCVPFLCAQNLGHRNKTARY